LAIAGFLSGFYHLQRLARAERRLYVERNGRSRGDPEKCEVAFLRDKRVAAYAKLMRNEETASVGDQSMGRTTALRREIKRVFVPYVESKDFSSDLRSAPNFLCYRRIEADEVHVCDIQWEKYGRPRFVLNFGKAPADGVVDILGKHVMPEDILPSHAPIRGRLTPHSGGMTGSWFRQDRPLIERLVTWSRLRPPEQVISQLMTLFAEVEEFWKSGTIGPHMRLLPSMNQLVHQARARQVAATS